MRLRRALVPLREVLNTLVRGDYDFFQRDTLVYLRDAFDHTLHLIESLEAAREVIPACWTCTCRRNRTG